MKRTIVVALLMLAACSRHQTVEWYAEHEAERKERLNECMNDAADAKTPDCQNAGMAEMNAMTGKMLKGVLGGGNGIRGQKNE